jgi:hypothetical protein
MNFIEFTDTEKHKVFVPINKIVKVEVHKVSTFIFVEGQKEPYKVNCIQSIYLEYQLEQLKWN